MTNRRLCAAILTAAALMTATSVAAQVTTGTIVGTVSDTNGVVPGASVTIREVSKNTSDTYVTDQNGSYSAPFLTPGTYAVEVQVQGFKKWVRDGVILQVNQRARVDVGLEVGGFEETTTVTAEAPLPRTDPVQAVHARRSNERRVPVGRVQLVQSSGLWLPESELRFADCREDHVDGRGQQVDAVLGESEFLG